jgi:hypothetical protein
VIPDRHIPTLILPTLIPITLKLKLPLLPILNRDTTPTLSRLLVLKRLQRVSSTTDTIKTTILLDRHCLLRPLTTVVLLSFNQLYLLLPNNLLPRCLPTILPHHLRLRTESTEVLLSVVTRQQCKFLWSFVSSISSPTRSFHHLLFTSTLCCSKQKDRR